MNNFDGVDFVYWELIVELVKQSLEYLIEMEINCKVKVHTQDLCFDVMLWHQLSQKLRLIRNGEFNDLINILTALM